MDRRLRSIYLALEVAHAVALFSRLDAVARVLLLTGGRRLWARGGRARRERECSRRERDRTGRWTRAPCPSVHPHEAYGV